MKTKTKWYQGEIAAIVLSLAITVMAYLLFTYVSDSIASMLTPIIFLLVLIYLKMPNQK